MELSWMCLISIRWSSMFHYLLSDGLVESRWEQMKPEELESIMEMEL